MITILRAGSDKMISSDKKRDIFNLWFIKRHNKREISRMLNISRGTLDKIIKRFQQKIVEINLPLEDDLLRHIDKIVIETSTQRKRKPYKLNEETISHIEKIVINNEKLVRLGSEEAMTTKELFLHFQKQKKEKPSLEKDFSIDTFYKYVRKFKKSIHENGI